jgi:HEPN domain-containing protein
LTRADLQRLALKRLEDAEILFKAERFDASFYLAGYAVECALKACIAKRTQQYEFPDKPFATKVYTHNLDVLLEVSELRGELAKDEAFKANWNIVKEWSEESRYREFDQQSADGMLRAVSSSPSGVLQCIQKYW